MSFNNNNTFISSNSVRLNLNERSNVLRKDKNKLGIDIDTKDKEIINVQQKLAVPKSKKTLKKNLI